MKHALYSFAIIVIGIILAPSAFADVKIKSRQTMSGQTYENTTFIKGKRQRSEAMNGMSINLTQCDLRRGIQLNPQTKTYVINSFDDNTQPAGNSAAIVDKNGVVHAGGRVTTTVTIKDTGERKQMFGFTARHLIITMETVSSPDACSKTNMKMQTDGWYIDTEFVLDCDYGYQNYNNYKTRNGGCRDKYEMKTMGTAKRGYPLYEKMTMFDESGKETYSMVSEVIELSKATLEAALFEVPSDYREVSDATELYAAQPVASTSSATNAASSKTMVLPPSSNQSQALGNAPVGNDATVQPKKPGVVRIGLAGVKTGEVGNAITAGDLAVAVQNTLAGFLKMPNVEVIILEAKLATALAAEARASECDYVILATASHKKGGGGGFGSMFGQALGSAIGHTGIGHTGSTAGNVAGQIATNAVVSAATVSANVKSKDEVTLDLKLNNIDGTGILARAYKAKAKSNGDDIISQVVEQAAEEIARIVVK